MKNWLQNHPYTAAYIACALTLMLILQIVTLIAVAK